MYGLLPFMLPTQDQLRADNYATGMASLSTVERKEG